MKIKKGIKSIYRNGNRNYNKHEMGIKPESELGWPTINIKSENEANIKMKYSIKRDMNENDNKT